MGLFKIFNKGKECSGSYESEERARREIERAVKRSERCKDLERQKKSDYKIIKSKKNEKD